MHHLASAQYWNRRAGGDTEHLFLVFGGPVCADRISNCPLDRVLTYITLIYLLNLQISGFLQQIFLGFKTQQMETYPRSELIEQISEIRDFQNGDTREYKDFLTER